MDTFSDDALAVRRHLYEAFLAHGRCGNFADIMTATGLSPASLRTALKELEDGVMVMLERDTDSVIVKCPPWANIPTPHVIEVDGAFAGYAGCAFEAINACYAYPDASSVVIRSSCSDCGEKIELRFEGSNLSSYSPDGLVVHVGVNPASWDSNWIAACANNNFFANLEHAAAWEETFPEFRGMALPIAALDSLPRYTDRLDYERGPDQGGGRILNWLAANGTVPDGWR